MARGDLAVPSHRKGIPSTQLARELGMTQKTAWFMLGRLREEVAKQINSAGGPSAFKKEADDTYVVGLEKNKHASKRLRAGCGAVCNAPVLGVKNRESGQIRLQAAPRTDRATMHRIIKANVAKGSTLYTDKYYAYRSLVGFDFGSVAHSVGEYVNGQAHTNGIKRFWSLLKRGYIGTFHYLTWKRLHRYLDEFQARWHFRKMDVGQRLEAALGACSGCRLTYAKLIK